VAGEEDVAVVEVGIGDEGRRQGAERARRKNAIGAAERAARKKMPQNARGWRQGLPWRRSASTPGDNFTR